MRALRGLVAGIAHRPTALHDPLLEASEGPANPALRKAEAEHRGAVDGVLLRVAHEFERDRPRPRDGDEREPALVEYRLRDRVLGPRGRVINRVIRPAELTAFIDVMIIVIVGFCLGKQRR